MLNFLSLKVTCIHPSPHTASTFSCAKRNPSPLHQHVSGRSSSYASLGAQTRTAPFLRSHPVPEEDDTIIPLEVIPRAHVQKILAVLVEVC